MRWHVAGCQRVTDLSFQSSQSVWHAWWALVFLSRPPQKTFSHSRVWRFERFLWKFSFPHWFIYIFQYFFTHWNPRQRLNMNLKKRLKIKRSMNLLIWGEMTLHSLSNGRHKNKVIFFSFSARTVFSENGEERRAAAPLKDASRRLLQVPLTRFIIMESKNSKRALKEESYMIYYILMGLLLSIPSVTPHDCRRCWKVKI